MSLPLLFALYLNDLEEEFRLKGSDDIDTGMLKIFLLIYADDIIIAAQSPKELQKRLDTSTLFDGTASVTNYQ